MIKTHTDKRYDAVIHSREWQRVRGAALSRDEYLCQDCLKRGVITPAQEVHHIKPLESIKDNGEFFRLAFALENLVSLCRECHHVAHVELASHSALVAKERRREAVEEFEGRFF